jgi:hypothetical protein
MEKECYLCKEFKHHSEYGKYKRGKDGLSNWCKSCRREYDNKRNQSPEKLQYFKDHYQKTKEYQSQQHKKYWDKKKHNTEIKEKRKEYNKEYYSKQSNKDKQNHWVKTKRKECISFKIRHDLRVRLIDAINKKYKSGSTLDLLGCGIDYFLLYLSNNFLPEMTWENHGEIWEIDHILPCVIFDLTIPEEQQLCFHYTNMQPLFKTTKIAESFGYLDQIGNRNKSGKF